jgi:quercetin dioxygenase-like cupin family protein
MAMSTTQLVVRGPEQGRASWFLNSLVTERVQMAETGGAYGITEHLLTAASNPPVHVHDDEDEAFYVLDGELELEVAGQVVVAGPGTYALAPRAVPHTFRVLTPTVRMLVIGSGKASDNIEHFFHAVGDPAAERVLPEPGAPDIERLASVAAADGIAFV